MVITVSDTNIIFDLITIDLLEEAFCLPYEFHTTQQVIEEILNPGQRERVNKLIVNNFLHVITLSAVDLENIETYRASEAKKLSSQDCSVLFYARDNGFSLLTGDRNLRKKAEAFGLEVHGIFFLLDELVNSGIIDKQMAIDRLTLLFSLNSRLPAQEVMKRLKAWQK